MRSSFHYSITALSTEPTLSGPASVPHSLAGQRAQAANPYGSSPHLLIPALGWLLTASFSLLICFSTLAQNYSAGIGSGTGGNYNVRVGPDAGRITTSDFNSFLGYRAGYSNTTGSYNSFLGYQSGYKNDTGSANSFLGTSAGYSNTAGNNNSFMGHMAGYSNTMGSNNSFLGYAAGNKNTEGSFNSFIGYQAGAINTTGNGNSFVGAGAGFSNTKGSYNSFLGGDAGNKNTEGSSNSFLGAFANVSINNLTNASAIGSRALVSRSNSLVLGSIGGVNGAIASTNVGIGTPAPTHLLHVNGDAAKPGGGAWTVASDRRLKKNIATFSEGLDVLQKVKPVWFEYNGEAGMPTGKKYVGIIAQEMQKIAPYTVGEFTYQDTTGKQEKYLDYDANALTYILVNSAKQQQEMIEKIQQAAEQKNTQITELQQENAALMQRLQLLEVAVNQLSGEPLKATGAAQLYQNAPNPTEGTTLIGYFLPQEATSAQLKVYSMAGLEVQSIDLKERGKGQVSLSVGRLAAGQYIYHLLVDGQSVASKKLLLNR